VGRSKVSFFKKDEPLIRFVSTVKGLSSIPEVLPKPAIKFIPNWWKKSLLTSPEVSFDIKNAGNVKNCPSFVDYFSRGFILPMWVDSILSYNKDTKEWKWQTADSKFSWGMHSLPQFLDTISYSYVNKPTHFVFKATSPWRIITPKGYSVYQLPLFYHQNDDFSVLPGIVDTDYFHQANPQVLFHSNNLEIFIKRGTPLVQYIPFKRDTLKFKVSDATDKEMDLFDIENLRFNTSFTSDNVYLKMRKEQNEQQ
jgi:hypothetical protein